MASDNEHPDAAPPADETHGPDRWFTVPNAITLVRIVGMGVLLPLAYYEKRTPFVVLMLVLSMSDWVDGKVAILLNQKSRLGARLDSLGDVLLYLAMGTSIIWLCPDFVPLAWPWLLAIFVTYVASGILGLRRFGQWPTYHTRLAKTCWLLILIGAVDMFAFERYVFVRVAMGIVVLTNIEAMLISLVLPACDVDVTSIFHARRMTRDRATEDNKDGTASITPDTD